MARKRSVARSPDARRHKMRSVYMDDISWGRARRGAALLGAALGFPVSLSAYLRYLVQHGDEESRPLEGSPPEPPEWLLEIDRRFREETPQEKEPTPEEEEYR